MRVQGDNPPKRGIPQPLRGGPQRFGPYLLEARIAVGGTAEVYLAKPLEPGTEGAPPSEVPPGVTRLVVKRLLPHFLNDPEGRTMFEREAVLHQAVNHPNVVHVFASGMSEQGEPYLAMEYIDGVDGYRLLRRFRQEGRIPPTQLSTFVVREILDALESVHSAKDANGTPLGIIHRDVTPSNLYLSREGVVKLGDFGIARSTSRATMRNAASAMLKGKIAYLAPEQVAGEPFDYRADLFSVACVYAEMLLGKPLFPGAGQLAILLAIRDCKIEPLREMQSRLPKGLLPILEKALARDPKQRFSSAKELSLALAPYDPSPFASRQDLAAHVVRAQTSGSSDAIQAARDGLRTATPGTEIRPKPPPLPPRRTPNDAAKAASKELEVRLLEDEAVEELDPSAATTAQISSLPSHVVFGDGTRAGPWTFARLVEALATGEVGRGDRVAYMGRDMKAVEEIEELVRFLPAKTATTTNQVEGPGAPDFKDDMSSTGMLEVLLKILEKQETGVLFAESGTERGPANRKELYFSKGKLHHVASSNASELLGEYLVRRGHLERADLDMALALLPKYGGRMGDTLIAMRLVGPVDIFRAIREQGRDRVADLFTWKRGTVSFYRGQSAPHVEFPLDLELPTLMIPGLEAMYPDGELVAKYAPKNDVRLVKGATDRPGLVRGVRWPPVVTAILSTCLATPLSIRELLAKTSSSLTSPGDVLRVVDLLLAAHLLRWERA